MEEEPSNSLEPTAEQVRYATVLEKGMYLGLACLFVTFALYVFGVMEPYLPRDVIYRPKLLDTVILPTMIVLPSELEPSFI